MKELSKQLSAAKSNLGKAAHVVVIGDKYDYPIYFTKTYVGAYLRAKDSDKGNDLSDGKPDETTWNSIVADIRRCERGA